MKKLTSIFLGICMASSFVNPVLGENSVQRIYVSCSGSDNNNGTSEEKAVKTLKKANERVLAYLNVFKGQDIEVIFSGGTYDFEKSSELVSGKDGVKVTYTAKEGESVIFRGSKDLDSSKFQKVSDDSILSRIPETSRNNVYCMDISNISDSFSNPTTGYYGSDGTGYYELIKDSEEQTLARYPNDGYMTATVFGNGTLTVSEEKAQLWKSAGNYQTVRLNGYLKYDWAYARTYITGVDGANVSFYQVSGVSAADSNKFYVEDLLEELDSPGEYFIDRTAKILYYYPKNEILANDRYELSLMSQPLISLEKAKNITVKNISFENMRGNAIEANKSDNITILDCNFKNIGNYAILAQDCTNFTVDSSEFCNIGANGIRISGGNSDTLEQANNKIVNSYFEKNGQVYRSYHGAVKISGCGNLVANNTMKDTPHQMIGYTGTYNRILYNDIQNACTDSGDMGAIYSGRSVIWRGNEIAYNYIHDITSNYSDYFLVAGIYLDDGLAGQKVHHNVIKNVSEAIFAASGSDNSIHDNIIIDSESAITLSQSNGKEDSYYSIFKEAQDFVSAHSKYAELFPTLKYIDTEKTLARGNFIYDNLIVASGCKLYDNNYTSMLQFGNGGRNNRRTNNEICNSFDGFTDAENENYSILPENEILQKMPNLSMIDMSKIGYKVKNDYGYEYEDTLKAEINKVLNNMDKHMSYGDYSYFDTVDEYFAKAEVNEIACDDFLQNPVYVSCIEQRKQYEDMSCIMLDLDYNMHDIYSSDKGYVGSAGYAGAFYYNDFLSDKYITWVKPWTDGMIDNVLINDNIRFKLRVIDHKKYTDRRNCVLWNNDENSIYTTIDVKDGYYNTAEFLANSDRPTTVKKYMTVVLRYWDGTAEAYQYPMNYFCNGAKKPFVSSTRTVDDKTVGDDYELTNQGYLSHRSVPVDNTKKLLAIDVLNDRYNLTVNEDGSFKKDENGDFAVELDSGTNRMKYHGSTAIYAVTMTQNKELADKSSDEALALEEVNGLIKALPEVDKLLWEDKSKLDEIDDKINTAENSTLFISQIENYDKFLKAKERMKKLEPKYIKYDMSKLYNAGLIYANEVNLLGNAGYPGAFYYYDFISDKYINWKQAWTETMTENTLISENVPFKLRVIPHDKTWKNTGNMVFKNSTNSNDDEKYTKFDIPDGKYTSIRILANSDQGEGKKLGIKINYTDSTSTVTELSMQYIHNGLHSSGCGGIKSTLCLENAQSAEELTTKGGITHYDITLDTEKTLDNIEILNDRFEFAKDENGEYKKNDIGEYIVQKDAGTSRYSFTHTAAIYAITLETNEALQGLADAFDVTEFTLSEKEGKAAAKITFDKLYESDATLYCALYSENGQLLEVKSEKIYDQKNIELVFESLIKDNLNYTAKYFIWDSKMKPLVTK